MDISLVTVIGASQIPDDDTAPRGLFADVVPNREILLGQPLADQVPAGLPLPDRIRAVPAVQRQYQRQDPGVPISNLKLSSIVAVCGERAGRPRRNPAGRGHRARGPG
jgi:hypothetical protein